LFIVVTFQIIETNNGHLQDTHTRRKNYSNVISFQTYVCVNIKFILKLIFVCFNRLFKKIQIQTTYYMTRKKFQN